MAAALLVGERGKRQTVDELGMRCDAKEIPDHLGERKPEGWWIAGLARVTGRLPWRGDAAQPLADLRGLCQLAVTDTALYAILSPQEQHLPAVWLTADRGELAAEAVGTQGLFRKRPVGVRVRTEGWTLELQEIARLFRSSNRFQTGQEGSLAQALGPAG